MKSLLEQLLLAAVRKLVGTLLPQEPEVPVIVVERAREAAHGDFTSNVAMRLANAADRTPRELAQAIVAALPASSLVLRAEVAGNGFINFFLARDALARGIRVIHELGDAYGRSSTELATNASVPIPKVTPYPGEQQMQPGSRTHENPLYYVQYAHARAVSAMKEMKARGFVFDLSVGLDQLERLEKDTEQALIAALLRFPDEVEWAAANCAPHAIVYYLRAVANAFHNYYNAEKWIVDEPGLRNARLALVLAARQVIRNGLALLGAAAPESM